MVNRVTTFLRANLGAADFMSVSAHCYFLQHLLEKLVLFIGSLQKPLSLKCPLQQIRSQNNSFGGCTIFSTSLYSSLLATTVYFLFTSITVEMSGFHFMSIYLSILRLSFSDSYLQ